MDEHDAFTDAKMRRLELAVMKGHPVAKNQGGIKSTAAYAAGWGAGYDSGWLSEVRRRRNRTLAEAKDAA